MTQSDRPAQTFTDDLRAPVRHKPGVPEVRAVSRAVALLRAFSADKPRLTLTELAQSTQLDKGTARRLLHTLSLSGLVSLDSRTQHYMLDATILELSSAVQVGSDLREIAAPILADVAEFTASSAFLWVPHENAALCVDRVRAPYLHIDTRWFAVGARASLNCGAGPRVVLAFIDAQERERALLPPLPQRTPMSETDPQALREAAAFIRQQGWELASDDFYVGLAAIAVPVLDRHNTFVGSLSISGLTHDIVEGAERHLDILKHAAARIGGRLQTHLTDPDRRQGQPR